VIAGTLGDGDCQDLRFAADVAGQNEAQRRLRRMADMSRDDADTALLAEERGEFIAGPGMIEGFAVEIGRRVDIGILQRRRGDLLTA